MAIEDIRIMLTFKGHHKRKKLKRKLGDSYLDHLLDLWISVAQNRPSGILYGWDHEDIADYAGWEGDPDEFVMVLVKTHILDVHSVHDGHTYKCHDWEQHQPWVVGAEERSKQARLASLIKHHGQKKGLQIFNEQNQKPMRSASVQHPDSKQSASAQDADSTAPSPSPLPSPLPLTGKPDSSNHFSKKVGDHFKSIKESCKKISKQPTNDSRFNPYMWVQKKTNAGGHPGAIEEVLRKSLYSWESISNPWAYLDKAFAVINPNYNEAEAIKIHEELKNMNPDILKQFTDGMLKSI